MLQDTASGHLWSAQPGPRTQNNDARWAAIVLIHIILTRRGGRLSDLAPTQQPLGRKKPPAKPRMIVADLGKILKKCQAKPAQSITHNPRDHHNPACGLLASNK